MNIIIRERETGKAREILELARANNAIVVTPDPRAFRVKANSYGYNDIIITGYDDLQNGEMPEKPLLLHNLDKVLNNIIQSYYNIKTPIIGVSMTKE